MSDVGDARCLSPRFSVCLIDFIIKKEHATNNINRRVCFSRRSLANPGNKNKIWNYNGVAAHALWIYAKLIARLEGEKGDWKSVWCVPLALPVNNPWAWWWGSPRVRAPWGGLICTLQWALDPALYIHNGPWKSWSRLIWTLPFLTTEFSVQPLCDMQLHQL